MAQAFPTFFGNSFIIKQESIATSVNPIDTSQAAEQFVLLICGDGCQLCNQSFNKCTAILEQQLGIICIKGLKQDEVCFYDLERLTAACKALCLH